MEEKIKAVMFNLLCMSILFRFMKYKDTKRRMDVVPFSSAFNFGRNGTKDGMCPALGNCERISMAIKTRTEIKSIILKIFFSLICSGTFNFFVNYFFANYLLSIVCFYSFPCIPIAKPGFHPSNA